MTPFATTFVTSKLSPAAKPKTDLSNLPTEMLIMIFGHLRPEDQCMRPLTECCEKFKEICESRLIHMRLDFDTIKRDVRFSVSQRAYKEISVMNFEMPVKISELLKLINSSIESIQKLNISETSPKAPIFTPISTKALRFLFRCFPNVEELKISGATLNRKSDLYIGRNDLPNLKKLQLHNVTDDVIGFLKSVTWLEEICITGYVHSNSDELKTLIVQQTNLKLLETRPTFFDTPSKVLPFLRSFIGIVYFVIENIFELAPNLEYLELTLVGGQAATCTSIYLRGCRSDSLKTLKLIGYLGIVEEFLQNFPNLDIAQCSPNLHMKRL